MRIIADIDRVRPWNHHLMFPLVGGELVRVDANQMPDTDMPVEAFRKQFVRVVRKNTDGVWAYICVISRAVVEPLTRK